MGLQDFNGTLNDARRVKPSSSAYIPLSYPTTSTTHEGSSVKNGDEEDYWTDMDISSHLTTLVVEPFALLHTVHRLPLQKRAPSLSIGNLIQI